MPAQVTSALRRFTAAIREFTDRAAHHRAHRRAVLVLGAAGLGFAWLTQPSYTPLFSGLAGADANAIVEQLRADNVPYELTGWRHHPRARRSTSTTSGSRPHPPACPPPATAATPSSMTWG
jgi:hypothetical protein